MMRVLLVEDHADTAYITSSILQKYGYEVVIAPSFRDGLQIGRAESFDIALVNVGLPDGDGCDLLSHLGAKSPAIAIAFTGFAMGDDSERCRRAGFHDVIAKPVDPTRLLQTMTTVFGPRQQADHHNQPQA